MKSATNYFRKALLAAQYPVIEYKDKVFETITWSEISKGCLTPENAKRFWDDVAVKEEDNEKPKKSVVIALKTVLTEYEDGGTVNNDLEDLTSVFFLPAYLLQSGVLCVPDNQEPWIPREVLAPMVESLFVIGHASEFDDFLERTTDRRVQIETWEAYLSYAIELYENVTKIKFFEDPFEKYKIRFDNKFYVFEYQKIDSVMNLLKAYNALQYDEEPRLYTKITQCSIEPSRKIQSSIKREKMIGHVGQMGGEYPLSPSQRESISCFQEIEDGEVLAVNGPPGTGKTTLLQSIVADMYVKTALKREKAPIIVATSTNNQAVTNIIESFGKINPIGIKNLEKRWVTGVHSFAVYFPSKGKEAEAKRNNYQYTNVAGEAFVEEVESEDNRKNSQQVFDEAFIEYFGYKWNSLSEAVERIHEKYGKGLFLSEHRRCYNEIIQYCNELVYGGNLEPLRGSFQKDDSNVISDLLLPMNHVQVDTTYSQRVGTSRQNKNEAEAIVEWIAENFPVILERYQLRAEAKQLEFNSKLVLGIITPFKSQSTLIKRLINKRLPDYADDVSVGTVHTFQGAERNIIIFSSVYGNQEGCSFINRNTNLMNVAVSRAKDAFVVVGDAGCLVGGSKSAAGLLKEFCRKSVK